MKTKSFTIAAALLAMTSLSGPAALAQSSASVPADIAYDWNGVDSTAGGNVASCSRTRCAQNGDTASSQVNGNTLTLTFGGHVPTLVELYANHGMRGGQIIRINPKGASTINVPIQNWMRTIDTNWAFGASGGQLFNHIECGGNGETSETRRLGGMQKICDNRGDGNVTGVYRVYGFQALANAN